MRSQWFEKYAWPRFVLTTLVITFVLTVFADFRPGARPTALIELWILVGLVVASIRLVYRFGMRSIRKRTQAGASQSDDPQRREPLGASRGLDGE